MSSYVNADPKIMCVACVNRRADCFHHVKTRGAGGSDDKWNLMPVCIAHHNAIHMKGTSWMAFTFQGVDRWLQKHGWVNDSFRKKWLPPNGALE